MFLLKILLLPLSLIYQVIFYFDQKRKKPTKLPVAKSISVGNLSVGGTGKTPFTVHLAKLICSLIPDAKITVLSRGYGGKSSKLGALVQIDSDPELVGDEPLLLKKNLQECQVIIGRDRIRAFNQFADTTKLQNSFIILDDGFQHRQIFRDIDIVLIDSNRLLLNGFTIPVGLLREKLTAISRAHIVVFTKCKAIISDRLAPSKIQNSRERSELKYLNNLDKLHDLNNLNKLERKIQKKFPHIRIFHSVESLEGLVGSDRQGKILINSMESIQEKKVFAFTGLANPDSFFASIEKMNPKKIESKAYPDHYSYPTATINYLLSLSSNFDLIICTEKDYVKFSQSELLGFQEKLYYIKMKSEIIENQDWTEYWKNVLN